MVTLAALCLAHGFNMDECGDTELTRILQPEVLEKIRAKQAVRPRHSPLPEEANHQQQAEIAQEPVAECYDNGTIEGGIRWITYQHLSDKIEFGTKFYTTPPSTQALIAAVIQKAADILESDAEIATAYGFHAAMTGSAAD